MAMWERERERERGELKRGKNKRGERGINTYKWGGKLLFNVINNSGIKKTERDIIATQFRFFFGRIESPKMWTKFNNIS